jgi:hypothetical protein
MTRGGAWRRAPPFLVCCLSFVWNTWGKAREFVFILAFLAKNEGFFVALMQKNIDKDFS